MLVPGAVNPLLLAMGGDPLDELYSIGKSVRFRPSATPYFWRQHTLAGANRKKGAVAVWLDPTKIATASISNNGNMHVLMAHNGTNTAGSGMTAYSRIAFVGDDANALSRIQMHSSGSAGEAFVSNDMKRDLAAFGHLYVRWDTTIPMLECYWNGVEISYQSKTLPTLNADTIIGLVNSILALGMFTTTDSRHWDGYMAEPMVFIGQCPPVTAVGRFHSKTGQWRPIKFTGVYGAHDSFMDFSDASAVTAAALGADRSGNGLNWTPVNFSITAGATYDVMTHTPTDVVDTLNLLKKDSNATLVSGNLQQTTGVGGFGLCLSNISMQTGIIWAEVEATSIGAGGAIVGIAKDAVTLSGALGGDAAGWGYRNDGQKFTNGVASAYGAAYTSTDVIGIKVDLTPGSVEFFKQTGGSGSFISQGVAFTGLTGPLFFAGSDQSPSNSSVLTWNFGQQPLKNGTLPSGAKRNSTKNLPFPKIAKASSAFVAVTDTGANIAATLAAAAPWTDYIRIIKRRDAAGPWHWIFSDDPTNYMDMGATATARSAVPAFVGASYVGYSLRVSAQNGVATGRLTHVNGVADTVADGLGNARKMIMLKNEASGTCYVYHPELTAGKLMYLNTTATETADATLGMVLSNSFIVAAALPSGTYRWLSIAETDGFLKLGKRQGNASADGSFGNSGISPVFNMERRVNTGNWIVLDKSRNPDNPLGEILYFETPAAGSTSVAADQVSTGVKLRTASGAGNLNELDPFIYLHIGQPFRYANAR